MTAAQPRPGEPHEPPAPTLTGFGRPGRGGALAGLVTGGQAPPPAAAPPAAPAEPVPAAPPTPTEPPAPIPAHSAESRPPATSRGPAANGNGDSGSAAAPATGAEVGPPALTVDMADPAALVVSPTVISVPEPLMRRFERARRGAESNTAVVLDALRTHVQELPQLVDRARRPGAPAGEGELFPWRSTRARQAATKVRRVQLPIRPLAGELQVIDTLVGWVQQRLGTGARSLGGRTTRSEVVVAALEAYLPPERRRG